MNKTNIILNGTEKNIRERSSLVEIVQELGLQEKTFAIGVNGEVVSKNQYEKIILHNGDRVDVVHFVAGG